MQVDNLFDEVVSVREELRNMSLRTECHDFEVTTLPPLAGSSPAWHAISQRKYLPRVSTLTSDMLWCRRDAIAQRNNPP